MAATRVLIVGAGIAGRCLGLALRGGPWQVETVERAAVNRRGAGLAVQPNAMRALRLLGVAPAVEQAGTGIDRFQFRDGGGVLLCDVDLHALWRDVGPFVGITHDALHRALGPVPRCRAGLSPVAVRQHGGQVLVSFDDGTCAGYDLVVGADGLHSAVRRCTVVVPGPVPDGRTAWRSVARVGSEQPAAVQFWLGDDRFFGLCPVGDGLTYGFGNLADSGRREPVAGRCRRLQEAFADFGAPVRRYLDAVRGDGDVHCAPVAWLPEVARGDGRVALMGDAAHAMSPMMGQGGGMAIEDALVLADELRRTDDVPVATAAFAARRHARVEWVRAQSRALGELLRLPAPVRDIALREQGVRAFADRYRPLVAEP
jgi:2-polyprenyl-6-methoxyphenol hydroxylase-like FAD-dependent oxidoreductase